MIVLDTDIVTLLSYGKTASLQERIAATSEELAITIITRMEILQGRFASIRFVKTFVLWEILSLMASA